MHKMIVTEMRMLRWMCSKTREDRIRNKRFQEHSEVSSIGDKLTWFGHVQFTPTMTPLRKRFSIQVDDPPRK